MVMTIYEEIEFCDKYVTDATKVFFEHLHQLNSGELEPYFFWLVQQAMMSGIQKMLKWKSRLKEVLTDKQVLESELMLKFEIRELKETCRNCMFKQHLKNINELCKECRL